MLRSEQIYIQFNREMLLIIIRKIKMKTKKDPDFDKIVQTLSNPSEDSEYTLINGILF